MRAVVYLNTGKDHFFGWQPEHMGSLDPVCVITLPDVDGASPTHYLERVFAIGNGADPLSDDYYAAQCRSISVGDAIVLGEGRGQDTWVCDSLGWTKLAGHPVMMGHLNVPA